jgi:hypothetical protein
MERIAHRERQDARADALWEAARLVSGGPERVEIERRATAAENALLALEEPTRESGVDGPD